MKTKIKSLLYPKNSVLLLGLFTIIISLIYLIVFQKFGTPLSYVLYLVMSYFLMVLLIKAYTILKKFINNLINKNKYLKMFRDNYKISISFSLLFNVVYAVFKLITGIIYKSLWFISFSLYYFLLTLLRANLLKNTYKEKITLHEEYIKCRTTGIILLFTNLILTMIILVIVNQKIMNIYPTWIAITASTYTFYLIITSIYNLIKYRKQNSPLLSAAKVINVVTSLISLISLEIILIPTFGSGEVMFYEVMVISTGGGLALIIVVISLYMIIKSTEWLNNK